jgi:hypothetical protein
MKVIPVPIRTIYYFIFLKNYGLGGKDREAARYALKEFIIANGDIRSAKDLVDVIIEKEGMLCTAK